MKGLILLTLLVLGAEAGLGGWKRRPRCPYVRCKQPCQKVVDENGCFKCDCPPLCSPPKCESGCKLQEKFDGPCPECECFKDEIEEKKIGIGIPACGVPKCPPGCIIEQIFDGPCPGCECKDIDEMAEKKVMCDPPKCPRGCFVEIEFEGPCPGCECKKKEEFVPKKNCAPPKCPRGCSIEEVFDSSCPECVCKDEELVVEEIKKKCPAPVHCDTPNCHSKLDEDGCEICVCVPSCAPGCRMQVVKDACPLCICSNKRLF